MYAANSTWVRFKKKQYLGFTTKISVGTLSIVTTIMILFQCLVYSAEGYHTEVDQEDSM